MFLAHDAVKSRQTHTCKAIFTVCERPIHAGSSIKAEVKGAWSSNCEKIDIKKNQGKLWRYKRIYLLRNKSMKMNNFAW